MSKLIHIAGRSDGPFTIEAARAMHAAGDISAKTGCRFDESDPWRKFEDFKLEVKMANSRAPIYFGIAAFLLISALAVIALLARQFDTHSRIRSEMRAKMLKLKLELADVEIASASATKRDVLAYYDAHSDFFQSKAPIGFFILNLKEQMLAIEYLNARRLDATSRYPVLVAGPADVQILEQFGGPELYKKFVPDQVMAKILTEATATTSWAIDQLDGKPSFPSSPRSR